MTKRGRSTGSPRPAKKPRERSSQELAEHEARVRLELAARAGGVGFWDWDLLSSVSVYSDEWKRQIGHEPDEVGNHYLEWERRLHPDDREHALACVSEYLAGRNREYVVEFRLRHKDGSYRWILARGEAIRDAKGKPLRLVGCHIDVTERKAGERALIDSRGVLVKQKEELMLAMEMASLGRWNFDPDSRHLILDEAFVRLLRIPDNGGGPLSLPLDDYVSEFLPEDAVAAMTSSLNEAVAAPGRQQTRQLEHRWRRGDGTFAVVSVRFVLEKDAAGNIVKCYGVNQDITERKAIETRLERLLDGESVLSAVSQRFIEMDMREFDSVVLDALKTIAHFMGAVRASVFLYGEQGRILNPFEWTADPADTLREEIKTVRTGQYSYFHEELAAFRPVLLRGMRDLPRGSSEREYAETRGFRSMVLLPLASHTRLIGIFIIYGPWGQEDVFDQDLVPLLGSFAVSLSNALARRTAEEERVFLERQLFQSQKLEAIGTLAGGIAHDFNNILTAIVGNLELARMDLAGGQALDDSLTAIETAADRATALVQQILAFSRHHQHERRVVALPAIAAEAVRFVRATIPAVVAIDLSIGPGVPHVLAEPTQLHQILINLCANAWHALEESPGRIEIGVDAVMLTDADAARIGGISAGECARLTVTDNGCGMDEEMLKRIFEPFFTTKPVGKGTGLGMSVVLGIVQSHHGGITIDSTVGKGTTVRVYIPAARSAIGAIEPLRQAVLGHGERLLLLDDEIALARVVSQALERLGYRVQAFSDPRDAIRAFQADPLQFDLVIADYEMPEITGLDVAKAITQVRPELPIVLWSGRFVPDIDQAAGEIGVKRLVTKPCEPSELSRIVGEVLQLARQDGAGT